MPPKRVPTPFMTYAPVAVLIAACLAVYANIYANVFVFDDVILITGNKYLLSWHNLGKILTGTTTAGAEAHDRLYRPVVTLLHLIIYQLFGYSLIAYHLLNVFLHTLNACLLYWLGLRLGFRRGAVFAAALIWAVHPIHTEAVSYASETADTLSSTFCLAGLLALSEWKWRDILFASVFFILGLLSKESAVVFPLLAMSLLFLRSGDRWNPKTYTRTWVFWLIAALYFTVKMLIINRAGGPGMFGVGEVYDRHFLHRFYTFLATLPAYLDLLVWPRHLHMERDYPVFLSFLIPRVMAGAALCVFMALCLLRGEKKRATPLAWGVFWFIASFAPFTGLLMPVNGLIYEHWMYLPTMGLALGVAEIIAHAGGNYFKSSRVRVAAGGLVAVTALALGIKTFEQNKIWHDPVTFYENIFAAGERAPRAHNNLGTVYYDTGDMDKAIEQYKLAIDNSTNYAMPHYNMGISLLRRDSSPPSIEAAIKYLEDSIEMDPTYRPAYAVLADIYAALGDKDRADAYRRKANGDLPARAAVKL
jgi:hypothetical protein